MTKEQKQKKAEPTELSTYDRKHTSITHSNCYRLIKETPDMHNVSKESVSEMINSSNAFVETLVENAILSTKNRGKVSVTAADLDQYAETNGYTFV